MKCACACTMHCACTYTFHLSHIQAVLKRCLDGEFGDAAAEVKVTVLSFQFTRPGFPPYLILVGQTQSINHSNSFASDVMSLCVQAAKNNGNAVILNESTDGVS